MAKRKGEAHQNAPGRPARPTRPGQMSTRTQARDPVVASSDPQGEVSASTRNSPGAPAQSPVERQTVRETGRVSNRVHTRQPPKRTQPKTNAGRTRQGQPHRGAPKGYDAEEPSAPASAGASGRHNEPGSRQASACPAQPPTKAVGASPRGRERHHGVRKADRSTKSDRTGRGAAHHTGPRGTPERHAASQNQGTRTDAKQRCPPGAANPESAQNTQPTTARGQVPSNTSRRPDRRAANPAPAGHETAAVRVDACAPEGHPVPAGYERPPSRRTSARPEGTQPLPATNSHRPDGRVSAPQRRPAHATHSTTQRASTPVNRSEVAEDTAQHTGRAHR